MTNNPNPKVPSPNNEQEIQVQLHDSIPGAEFANVMTISHSEDSFLLTFMNIVDKSGKVVAKVFLTPNHFARLIDTFSDNLKKYKEKFAPIDATPATHKDKS